MVPVERQHATARFRAAGVNLMVRDPDRHVLNPRANQHATQGNQQLLRYAGGPHGKEPGQRTILSLSIGLQTTIKDKLLKVGITPPIHPDPNGTLMVDTKDLPRVGIWLMPDNRIKGILEHFVEQMIPTNDPVWPRSCKYVDDIPETERKFKINSTQKAKIHAWLATRKKPGLRTGTAILAQDFEIDGDLAQTFFTWLQKLFELEKLEEIETNS